MSVVVQSNANPRAAAPIVAGGGGGGVEHKHQPTTETNTTATDGGGGGAVECVNQCRGRGGHVTRIASAEGMNEHLRECRLQIIDCRFKPHGCTTRMPRESMDVHYANSSQSHMFLLLDKVEALERALQLMNLATTTGGGAAAAATNGATSSDALSQASSHASSSTSSTTADAEKEPARGSTTEFDELHPLDPRISSRNRAPAAGMEVEKPNAAKPPLATSIPVAAAAAAAVGVRVKTEAGLTAPPTSSAAAAAAAVSLPPPPPVGMSAYHAAATSAPVPPLPQQQFSLNDLTQYSALIAAHQQQQQLMSVFAAMPNFFNPQSAATAGWGQTTAPAVAAAAAGAVATSDSAAQLPPQLPAQQQQQQQSTPAVYGSTEQLTAYLNAMRQQQQLQHLHTAAATAQSNQFGLPLPAPVPTAAMNAVAAAATPAMPTPNRNKAAAAGLPPSGKRRAAAASTASSAASSAPLAPPRPAQSAFDAFTEASIARIAADPEHSSALNSTASRVPLLAALREQWNAMEPAQKHKYTAIAQADERRFEAEVAAQQQQQQQQTAAANSNAMKLKKRKSRETQSATAAAAVSAPHSAAGGVEALATAATSSSTSTAAAGSTAGEAEEDDASGASTSVAIQPKKPKTGYNYFQSAVRASISAEVSHTHPNAGREERSQTIARIIGERWKALPDPQRVPYQIQADRDKARYREQLRLQAANQMIAANSAASNSGGGNSGNGWTSDDDTTGGSGSTTASAIGSGNRARASRMKLTMPGVPAAAVQFITTHSDVLNWTKRHINELLAVLEVSAHPKPQLISRMSQAAGAGPTSSGGSSAPIPFSGRHFISLTPDDINSVFGSASSVAVEERMLVNTCIEQLRVFCNLSPHPPAGHNSGAAGLPLPSLSVSSLLLPPGATLSSIKSSNGVTHIAPPLNTTAAARHASPPASPNSSIPSPRSPLSPISIPPAATTGVASSNAAATAALLSLSMHRSALGASMLNAPLPAPGGSGGSTASGLRSPSPGHVLNAAFSSSLTISSPAPATATAAAAVTTAAAAASNNAGRRLALPGTGTSSGPAPPLS